MNRPLMLSLAATATLFASLCTPVFADGADQALIEQGRYVATAADCSACHTASGHGKPFAGGYSIASPMGDIIASNITPSKTHGIGGWTEEQFTRAVREGVTPTRHLYPAMPYTAYGAISDQDMHALWAYFSKAVAPVDEAPSQRTRLSFPFNIRALMIGWNLLYAREKPADAAQVAPGMPGRGAYLANALEHCSTCHTPRDMMMGERASAALSGSPLAGWYAPNITPDPLSGIGQWSEQDIVSYLKTGRAVCKAQAAGPMAEAVEHSLRHLNDDDLLALAKYLKTVPAVATPGVKQSAFSAAQAKPAKAVNLDPDIDHDPYKMADGSSTNGERLYVGACATCHQSAGQGTRDQFYPSLTSNTAVGGFNPANLVMTIVEGIHRETDGYTVAMPAFKDEFNNAQTAAVANYVIQRFGHGQATVTADDVATYRDGGEKPFIVRYVGWLMVSGVLAALVVLTAAWMFRRSRHA